MVIITIILTVFVIAIILFTCLKRKQKLEEIDNLEVIISQLIKDEKELRDKIKTLQDTLVRTNSSSEEAKVKLADLIQELQLTEQKVEYEKKLLEQCVESIKVQEETQEKYLQKSYEQKEKELYDKYNNQQNTLIESINRSKKELDSLLATKAATIQAFQREKALQEKKDFYRLDISEQDISDITFLNSIKNRLSKPRIISMLIWQTYYQPIAKQKIPLLLGTDKIVCGIYKITNLKNEMVYIGQAKNMRERWLTHMKRGCGIDTPQNNKLYQAIIKDGLENFSFELLEEVDFSLLNEKEQFYIEVYNAVSYGYNSRNQR